VRVVISVGGKFHAYHTVRAAQRAGVLERFITTVFDESEAGIDRSRVTQLRLPDLVGRTIRRVPPANRLVQWNWVKDNLFDLMARSVIPECDTLHAWSSFGLLSLRRAKRMGAAIVLERGSTHPLFQQRLLRDEYARWRQPVPSSSARLVTKQVQELDEADLILVPSSFARRSMVAEGISPGKVFEIPFGADLSLFKPKPKPDNVFRILFVGSVCLRKGIAYLLEAVGRLRLPRSELVLIGRIADDARDVLAQYSGTYRALGPVPHGDLPEHYNRASVLVLPSIEEGSALVTYEAMACALPVIVSTNTGSIARDGVDGYVVPAQDSHALADKIQLLYENNDLRWALGSVGGEYVRQFTWERYGEQVMAAYRHSLGEGR
jgi:glycosyltransferase involved in cell wall biosynthesis